MLDHDGLGKELRYKIGRQSHLFPSGTLCPLQPSPEPGSLLIPGFAFSFYTQNACALGFGFLGPPFYYSLDSDHPYVVTDVLLIFSLVPLLHPVHPILLLRC